MFNSEVPAQAELPGSTKLIWSTLLAIIGACVLLIAFVLPAEYGIDITGIGKKLGLTELAHVSNRATGAATDSLEITSTPTGDWRDEVSVTIPGYGQIELKLTMLHGDTASYEWFVNKGKLNSDMHGDGADDTFISYRESTGETENSGKLTAEFDGVHGWYWQNKSRGAVTVTLRTKGTYSDIKRVL